MLLVATAEVEANAQGEPFSLDIPPYRVDVIVDEDGYWNRVRVSKRVADWRDSLLHFVVFRQPPQPEPTVRPLQGDLEQTNEEIEDLHDLLRHLESFCGYVLDVDFIDWSCPALEWVPESDEEKAGLTCNTMDVHMTFDRKPLQLSADVLKKAVATRDQTRDLDVPLSFFREGKVDFFSGRFISAFFNFYFFIEGMYADGRSSEKQVLRRLLESAEVRRAALLALHDLESLTDPQGGRHAQNLKVFARELRLAWNADGLVRLLVRMRNLLHHYSHKSRGVRRGHPLNQDDYESLAVLGMTLCVHCVNALLSAALDAEVRFEIPRRFGSGKMVLPGTSTVEFRGTGTPRGSA